MRLHLLAAPDGTPRAAILASADLEERDVALRLFSIGLHGGELVVCYKGYAGREFEHAAAEHYGAKILRPARMDEPGRARCCRGSVSASSRSSGHSETGSASNDTAPAASTACGHDQPPNSTLAAGVWLNHSLGQPTRAFAALAA